MAEPRRKKYNEEYVINILTERAELNLKYRPLFADQSKRTENKTKLRNNSTETQNEREKNQSQTNRTFEKVNNVNKTKQSERTTSGQTDISTLNSSRKSEIADNDNMNRKNIYH